MVLVEVVELIVNIDGFLDFSFNLDLDSTWVVCVWVSILFCNRYYLYRPSIRTLIVILFGNTLNVVAHNVESHTEGQENEPKDSKDDHRRSK